MNYIYSKEQVIEGLYYKPIVLQNGISQKLININRSNLHSTIYLKVTFTGKIYFDLWRCYRDDNGNIQKELSNHHLIEGTGAEQEIIFYDYTLNKFNFISYYFVLESIQDTEIEIEEMGLIFDDILGSNEFKTNTTTGLKSDINQIPLTQQEYTKSVSFNNIIIKGQLQEYINVLERPFNYIHEEGCLNNNTKTLGNANISIDYVNGAQQFINATIANIEDV